MRRAARRTDRRSAVSAPAPTGAAGVAGAAGDGSAALGRAGGSGRILVRDTGFGEDDWTGEYLPWNGADRLPELPEHAALDVENTARAEDLAPAFERIALIRIGFPSHADGRGFSLARHLRLLGYRGRLRASGHVLADQYTMARRSGFDEVQIDPSLAQRQPEAQWLFRANWGENDYQARLRARPRHERSDPES